MFSICKGSLSMSSDDLDKIQERVNNGDSPKQALANELNNRGMKIKDVFNIELSGYLIQKPQYLKLYSEIVADCLNNK